MSPYESCAKEKSMQMTVIEPSGSVIAKINCEKNCFGVSIIKSKDKKGNSKKQMKHYVDKRSNYKVSYINDTKRGMVRQTCAQFKK